MEARIRLPLGIHDHDLWSGFIHGVLRQQCDPVPTLFLSPGERPSSCCPPVSCLDPQICFGDTTF